MTDWKEQARNHEESANEYARINYELKAEIKQLDIYANALEAEHTLLKGAYSELEAINTDLLGAIPEWAIRADKLEITNADLLEALKKLANAVVLGTGAYELPQAEQAIRKAEEQS